MKEFFIGMAVMYFIVGIIIFILINLNKDIDNIYCYIFIPYFVLIAFIGNQISYYFKYHNIKSMVYDCAKEKWFYCEREEFDEIENKMRENGNFQAKILNEALEEFSKKYLKYYDKRHIDFGYIVNRRYTPKEVWKNFEKYS